MDLKGDVSEDPCEVLGEDAGMCKVLSDVVGDIVILAVEVKSNTNLEGIDNGETRTGVGT